MSAEDLLYLLLHCLIPGVTTGSIGAVAGMLLRRAVARRSNPNWAGALTTGILSGVVFPYPIISLLRATGVLRFRGEMQMAWVGIALLLTAPLVACVTAFFFAGATSGSSPRTAAPAVQPKKRWRKVVRVGVRFLWMVAIAAGLVGITWAIDNLPRQLRGYQNLPEDLVRLSILRQGFSVRSLGPEIMAIQIEGGRNVKEDPALDAALTRLKDLVEVKDVSLHGKGVTNAVLSHVSSMRQLERLGLSDISVTDAGLEQHLKGLTSLQELSLYGTQFTDASLEHLKGLTNLQTLDLSQTKVTDAGLDYLKGLTNLHTLNLNYTQATNDGINKLQEALPDCKIRH